MGMGLWESVPRFFQDGKRKCKIKMLHPCIRKEAIQHNKYPPFPFNYSIILNSYIFRNLEQQRKCRHSINFQENMEKLLAVVLFQIQHSAVSFASW